MKKTFIAFALAFMAVLSFACDVLASAGSLLGGVYRGAKSFAMDAIEALAREDVERQVPKVPLVRAKSFIQRILKRERPVVMPSWRMCPSV